MIDVYLYPSAVPIVDIILSDPSRARSIILGRDDRPPEGATLRRQQLPEIVARSLMRDLNLRYGAGNGRRIYYAMQAEGKGPFAPGAKYGGRPGRPATPPRIPPAKGN